MADEAKYDLTLREMEEGEEYGLTPEQYADLKKVFTQRAKKTLVQEVKAEAKEEFERSLRSQLWAELRPSMREEVEKELRPKLSKEIEKDLRTKLPAELKPEVIKDLHDVVTKNLEEKFTEAKRVELRKEVEAENAKATPTPAQRRGAAEYLLEAEVECLTSAEVASEAGGLKKQKHSRAQAISRVLTFFTVAALGPLCFYLFGLFGPNPLALLFLVPAIVLFAYARVIAPASDPVDSYGNRRPTTDTFASRFLVLAERARRLRLVEVPLADTKGAIREALSSFVREKESVDHDFHDRDVSKLQKVRIEVKNRILSDSVDPLKLFDVADVSRFEDEARLASKQV